MAQRTFISFDYDYDLDIKTMLVGQSKNPDSPFEISDWSIKAASSDWKDKARQRIKAAGLVIVLCGEHTHEATGVSVELAIAQNEAVSYFLLAGRGSISRRPTTAKSNDEMYTWTWDNLKALVGGAR